MFEQLQDALNKFQELEQELEDMQVRLLEKSCELDKANLTIDKLREKAVANQKTEAAASKAMALANINQKLIYSVEQYKLSEKKLKDEIQQLKGSDNPKKLREQNKRLKDKNSELQKGNDQVKRHNKAYRNEVNTLRKEMKEQLLAKSQLALTHAYTENNHELWLVPNKIGVDRGYGKEQILALLHLAPNGVGYLVTVKDGEISIDKSILDKDLPKMPQKMYEHAESWLTKVEAQGYAVTDADLMAIAGFKDLDEVI